MQPYEEKVYGFLAYAVSMIGLLLPPATVVLVLLVQTAIFLSARTRIARLCSAQAFIICSLMLIIDIVLYFLIPHIFERSSRILLQLYAPQVAMRIVNLCFAILLLHLGFSLMRGKLIAIPFITRILTRRI